MAIVLVRSNLRRCVCVLYIQYIPGFLQNPMQMLEQQLARSPRHFEAWSIGFELPNYSPMTK